MIDVNLPGGYNLRGLPGDYVLDRSEEQEQGGRTVLVKVGRSTYHATLKGMAHVIMKECGAKLAAHDITSLQGMLAVHEQLADVLQAMAGNLTTAADLLNKDGKPVANRYVHIGVEAEQFPNAPEVGRRGRSAKETPAGAPKHKRVAVA